MIEKIYLTQSSRFKNDISTNTILYYFDILLISYIILYYIISHDEK